MVIIVAADALVISIDNIDSRLLKNSFIKMDDFTLSTTVLRTVSRVTLYTAEQLAHSPAT